MADSSRIDMLASTALIGSIPLADAPWPNPVPVPNPVEGTPETRLVHLLDDGERQAGIWSCTPGTFNSDHRGYVEFMHIVDGEAELRGDDGTVWRLGPGTLIVIPDGWVGTWNVARTITKSFAIYRHTER